MATARRAEVLLDPDAYDRLEERAAREGISISELIHRAVQQTFPALAETRRSALARIAALDLPLGDWETLEEEILDARSSDLR